MKIVCEGVKNVSLYNGEMGAGMARCENVPIYTMRYGGWTWGAHGKPRKV